MEQNQELRSKVMHTQSKINWQRAKNVQWGKELPFQSIVWEVSWFLQLLQRTKTLEKRLSQAKVLQVLSALWTISKLIPIFGWASSCWSASGSSPWTVGAPSSSFSSPDRMSWLLVHDSSCGDCPSLGCWATTAQTCWEQIILLLEVQVPYDRNYCCKVLWGLNYILFAMYAS